MNSTPSTKDILIAHTDEQLARAREGIASVREGIARVTEKLSKLEQDDVRNPSAKPGDEAPIPAARPDPQPPQGKSAVRGSIGLLPVGLLLAACLVVAALVSQLSRDAVKLIADRWTPQHASTSTSQPANAPSSAQPGPSFKLSAAEAAPAQAAPLARTTPQDAAPAQAAPPTRTAAQDAAPAQAAPPARTAAQDAAPAQAAPPARTAPQNAAPAAAGVSELLKVKQGQIATDNAKAMEQLRAKLDDMTRQLAKVSEQSALARAPPPSTGPAQSLQARMRPPPPLPRRHYPPRWYYEDEW
jgi:uncharacterized coiled-coil protein SlyX